MNSPSDAVRDNAQQTKRVPPIHPLLIGLFPVLSVYASNAGLLPFSYVARPALIVLAAASLLWLILTLILRNAARAAMCVSSGLITVISFGYYTKAHPGASVEQAQVLISFAVGLAFGLLVGGRAKSALGRSLLPPALAVGLFVVVDSCLRFFRMSLSLPVSLWLLIPSAILLTLMWPKKGVRPATLMLNTISMVLVALPALSALGVWYSARLATRAAGQSEATPGAASVGQRPDVYFIVLDAFGRPDVLEKYFGQSFQPFVDGLRQRGFYVADKSHSNYPWTHQSLASALNLGYVQDVLPLANNLVETKEPLMRLIDCNEVARRLKASGYRYVGIMSGPGFIRAGSADVLYQDLHGRNPLESELLSLAPDEVLDEVIEDEGTTYRRRILGALSDLKHLSPSAAPKFVFAHFICPHPPFLFNADGSSTGSKLGYSDCDMFEEYGGKRQDYKVQYPAQAQFISGRILDCIDSILARSKTSPVIVLIGDHGSRMNLSYKSLERSDFGESYCNLTAVLAPKATQEKLYSTVTPVNLMRIVTNSLTGSALRPLPDRCYYNLWKKPYQFVDVTKAVEAADNARSAQTPNGSRDNRSPFIR